MPNLKIPERESGFILSAAKDRNVNPSLTSESVHILQLSKLFPDLRSLLSPK
jgi:hypothetical protein